MITHAMRRRTSLETCLGLPVFSYVNNMCENILTGAYQTFGLVLPICGSF